MQVIILAGGKGTRLRPLTESIPKSMVAIKGKPFLEHQLEMIKSYGFCDYVFLVGCMAEEIKRYFKDGSKHGVHIRYSQEETLLGTGGALKHAASMLADQFLLLNGDTYLPIDYRAAVHSFESSHTLAMVSVAASHEEKRPNNIAIDKDAIVTGYDKNNALHMTYVDAGAVFLKKEVLSFIKPNTVCSLEEEIFPQLIEAKQLRALPIKEDFYDMGSFEGLKELEEILL